MKRRSKKGRVKKESRREALAKLVGSQAKDVFGGRCGTCGGTRARSVLTNNGNPFEVSHYRVRCFECVPKGGLASRKV